MNKKDKLFFQDKIGSHPTILEIGAYDGKDSLEFLEIFPDSQIFAFEPDLRSIELFEKTSNSNIKLVKKAVSDITGIIPWYPSDSDTRRHHKSQKSWSASSSINAPKTHLNIFPDVYFKDPVNVESITLDCWVEENDVSKIDILWVDVNGGEKNFINGAIQTLSKKTKYLYIEYTNDLYENSLTIDNLKHLLPIWFYEINRFNVGENYGNILFENKLL